MNEKPISTRGRVWFEALAGKPAKNVPSVPSVLVADTMMEKERVRFLAIVADPDNRFPCARQGQVGLQEGWNLAKQVRDVIKADESSEKRAIIAIVDVPSQAYGRREELLAREHKSQVCFTSCRTAPKRLGHCRRQVRFSVATC